MDKKKKGAAACVIVVLLLIGIGLAIYPTVKAKTIQTYTSDYIVSLGYPAEEIREIRILHSYMNRFLGFNEWRISIAFEKKPDVEFWVTYRDGAIQYAGVNAVSVLDLNTYAEYSEKFKSGTLLED